MEQLPILFQDDHLVVIDKPAGLPVHKTRGMPHDAPYVTQVLGKQLDGSIYNVHRLDAKTSGVLLLARSSELAQQLTNQFAQRTVQKRYVAIVKGVPPASGTLDLPVKKARKGKKAKAVTHFKLLETLATGREHREEANQAISLLELFPETGRWHQLRQHCAQQRYDIIGDSEHGDYGLNRLVAGLVGYKRLYLHSQRLTFTHPVLAQEIMAEAMIPKVFEELLQLFRGTSEH
ncbi:MAG: pseudouridine synthase [Bacteroidota bacterium]